MRWMILALMIGLTAPAAGADELTDALVPADPRDRLETGEGAALGSVYAPPAESDQPARRPPAERDETPSLSGYGSPYDDLRSSLYTSPLEDDDNEDEDNEEEGTDQGVEQPYHTTAP